MNGLLLTNRRFLTTWSNFCAVSRFPFVMMRRRAVPSFRGRCVVGVVLELDSLSSILHFRHRLPGRKSGRSCPVSGPSFNTSRKACTEKPRVYFWPKLEIVLISGSLKESVSRYIFVGRAQIQMRINGARAFRQSLHLQVRCISGEYKRKVSIRRHHWLDLA